MRQAGLIERVMLAYAVAVATASIHDSAFAAQRSNADGSPATFNYAFATQLGSGIYRINERTVQVYRLAGPVRLREGEFGHWGLRLYIPVTFGFYSFKVEDVIESGLPDQVATLALVPTLEFGLHLKESWWLGPFLGLGVGKDFSGGEANFIYATGVRSLAIFPRKHVDIRLGNRLVYTGYTSEEMDFVDDFAFLETGVEFRRPLGFDLGSHGVDAGIFGANYIYFVSPHVVRLLPEPVEIKTEWEVGVTFGTTDQWKVIGLRLPRIGISYRFGTGMDAIRFIIGNPFPTDTPDEKGPGIN